MYIVWFNEWIPGETSVNLFYNFLKVMWLVKGKPVDASDADNIHFISTLLPGDIVEAAVTLKV